MDVRKAGCAPYIVVWLWLSLETQSTQKQLHCNLCRKNSKLPTPHKSCEAKMGWQNQRNSLWHILLHKKQKRESQVHYWPIGSRTPKAPGRGERCVSFHTPYKICPIKPILLLYKGFLKDTYLFFVTCYRKNHENMRWACRSSSESSAEIWEPENQDTPSSTAQPCLTL